ncbi:MAG: VOC family protein [Pseudomonadota bacterium]
MNLGDFSVSLPVTDIAASRAFYEALGFEVFAGDQTQNWLIMKSGDTKIGLFQGMFDSFLLTFNPHDARSIAKAASDAGLAFAKPIPDEEMAATGPTSFALKDPDGHMILIDQHDE